MGGPARPSLCGLITKQDLQRGVSEYPWWPAWTTKAVARMNTTESGLDFMTLFMSLMSACALRAAGYSGDHDKALSEISCKSVQENTSDCCGDNADVLPAQGANIEARDHVASRVHAKSMSEQRLVVNELVDILMHEIGVEVPCVHAANARVGDIPHRRFRILVRITLDAAF